MMYILNLVCEYLAMVYTDKHDISWCAMNNNDLYIRTYKQADKEDIYRQIKLYCYDLDVTMDTITYDDDRDCGLLITLSTGEKIDLSCAL